MIRDRGVNYEIVDETHSLDGWINYDEKQDRRHGEGVKLVSNVWDALLSRKSVAPRKCYADVSMGMEQVRGNLCYISLITCVFNEEDAEEAYRRVGVAFIKAGKVSCSEAVVMRSILPNKEPLGFIMPR